MQRKPYGPRSMNVSRTRVCRLEVKGGYAGNNQR